VRDLTCSPDGKLLASSSDDGTLKIWEITIGRCLQTLPAPGAVLFSPDSKQLLAAPRAQSGGTIIRLLNSHSGRLVRQIKVPEQLSDPLDWSRDGRVVAFAWKDSAVQLRRADT
jgi:WD40 repeat protein